MKNKILLCSLLFAVGASAQTTYYKIGNGKPMSQAVYDGIKTRVSANGVVKEEFLKKETRQDSIIKTVKLSIKEGTLKSSYALAKDIGKRFPIEKFKDSKGGPYAENALDGKPTFINFWFTRCKPCIEEIPSLNALKKKFGDKVNFIAITFDSRVLVDSFLKKQHIDFEHITDATPQLFDLEVQVYPMNVLLDKDGKIVKVTGDIMDKKKEIANSITKLL